MTIQAELWQLILASLVPVGVVLVTAGKQAQKIVNQGAEIQHLKERADRMDMVYQSLARIETDLVWVKQALAYATRDKFSDR